MSRQYRTSMSIPSEGVEWIKAEAARYFMQPMGMLRILLVNEYREHGSLEHVELADVPECDTTFNLKLPMALIDHVGGARIARAAIRYILAREAGLVPKVRPQPKTAAMASAA